MDATDFDTWFSTLETLAMPPSYYANVGNATETAGRNAGRIAAIGDALATRDQAALERALGDRATLAFAMNVFNVPRYAKVDTGHGIVTFDARSPSAPRELVGFVRATGLFAIEVNYYGTSGSKPNEIARAYQLIDREMRGMGGIDFVWVTDGPGWKASKDNLREAYANIGHVYDIADVRDGRLSAMLSA